MCRPAIGLLLCLAGAAVASPLPAAGAEATTAAGPPLTAAGASEILAAVHAPGAAAVLVNVWATWCLPCREEMPDLLRLRQAYADRGLRVILVSGDFTSERSQAESFLRQQGVDFPTFLKTGDDMAFIDAFDPAWTGALPATFLYDRSGQRRASLFGKSSYATFEESVKKVLGEPVRQ